MTTNILRKQRGRKGFANKGLSELNFILFVSFRGKRKIFLKIKNKKHRNDFAKPIVFTKCYIILQTWPRGN